MQDKLMDDDYSVLQVTIILYIKRIRIIIATVFHIHNWQLSIKAYVVVA